MNSIITTPNIFFRVKRIVFKLIINTVTIRSEGQPTNTNLYDQGTWSDGTGNKDLECRGYEMPSTLPQPMNADPSGVTRRICTAITVVSGVDISRYIIILVIDSIVIT